MILIYQINIYGIQICTQKVYCIFVCAYIYTCICSSLSTSKNYITLPRSFSKLIKYTSVYIKHYTPQTDCQFQAPRNRVKSIDFTVEMQTIVTMCFYLACSIYNNKHGVHSIKFSQKKHEKQKEIESFLVFL